MTNIMHAYNVCMYTHGGWAHRQWVSTTFLTRKKSHKFFLCSWRGSNLGSWNPLDLEAVALPIEPPCHPRRTEDRLWVEPNRTFNVCKLNTHRSDWCATMTAHSFSWKKKNNCLTLTCVLIILLLYYIIYYM